MILIDTNVLSEPMKPNPDSRLVSWLDAQRFATTGFTAITLGEMLSGIARMPEGRKKAEIDKQTRRLVARFAGRILPFDQDSAAHYAIIMSTRIKSGRPIQTADAQIAAICRQHHATLATRNVNDFADCGIRVVNPWTD